jgi:hypothetical protein
MAQCHGWRRVLRIGVEKVDADLELLEAGIGQ